MNDLRFHAFLTGVERLTGRVDAEKRGQELNGNVGHGRIPPSGVSGKPLDQGIRSRGKGLGIIHTISWIIIVKVEETIRLE